MENFMINLLLSKLETALLPELMDSLKKSWTPALEAEVKMILVKWLKSITDGTGSKVDDFVVGLIAQALGVSSSDMQ